MAAFSDTIEATFITSVYVTRASTTPDASGNYGTTVTTPTSGMLGDIQPAPSYLFHQTGQGVDYVITHRGFFDVPGTLPDVNDRLIDGSAVYGVRNVRNFKDHLEVDL